MNEADYKQQAETIYRLVLELKSKDTNLSIFGAEEHKYRIEPPLNEEEVLVFEKTHCISLPKDYRYFITNFYSAGTGPNLGLISLKDSLLGGNRIKPELPFTYERKTPSFDESDYDTAVRANYHGMIALADWSCLDEYHYLIVNGQYSGEVWSAGNSRFWRQFPSFNEWMLYWMSSNLEELETER